MDINFEGLTMQVAKWGNRLAVRLPGHVVEALELRVGDDIEIGIAAEAPRTFGIRKKPDTDERLKQLRVFRGRLPADFKFEREEANACG